MIAQGAYTIAALNMPHRCNLSSWIRSTGRSRNGKSPGHPGPRSRGGSATPVQQTGYRLLFGRRFGPERGFYRLLIARDSGVLATFPLAVLTRISSQKLGGRRGDNLAGSSGAGNCCRRAPKRSLTTGQRSLVRFSRAGIPCYSACWGLSFGKLW